MSARLKDLPPAILPDAEQALLALNRREDIVLHTLRDAVAYLKRVSRDNIPEDELLSVAYAALTKAVRPFQSGRGRFISYAKNQLKSEISRYWRSRDVVRDAFRHEAPETYEFPKPLAAGYVEPSFEEIHWREQWARVEPVIRKTLTPIEIKVLEFRYKFSYTLEATGEEIGKSRERVRQIEKKALDKLRAALSNRGEL